MIFRFLGPLVSHHWKLILALWGLALLVCMGTAPRWADRVREGEFIHLPASVPSQIGEADYREAFSHDLLGSTAVIVVHRGGRPEGLLPQDLQFIEKTLKPAVERIVEKHSPISDAEKASQADGADAGAFVLNIRTEQDKILGRLLLSEDRKSTLVLVEFSTRSLDREHWAVLSDIETLIAQSGPQLGDPENLFARQLIPPGLSLSLSGSAVVARDLRENSERSTALLWQWLLLVGVGGLLLFYRAPLLAIAPLITIVISVLFARAVLAHLARAFGVPLYAGLEDYLVIALAGLGLFSSMLFVAHDMENRLVSPTLEDAATSTLGRFGPIVCSGGFLLLLGWGLLIVADFGAFRQLGWGLSIGTAILMLATITLLPALLVAFGRWVYWPNMRTERITTDQTWSLPRANWLRFVGRGWFLTLWKSLGPSLQKQPRTLLFVSLAAASPFVIVAVDSWNDLTYGSVAQLPAETPSVKGVEMIQEQFPAGTTGPVTLLIEHPNQEFHTLEGIEVIGQLSDVLEKHRAAFGIADIRSVAFPLGLSEKEVGLDNVLSRRRRHNKAVEYYVSDKPAKKHRATKLEIVLADDPYSRRSIAQFEQLRQRLPELLPPGLADARWHFLGSPASIRDLKAVTDRDRSRTFCLIGAGLLVGLWLLVRRLSVALTLLAASAWNVLVSLGGTFMIFWLCSPEEFSGLVWLVPTLLSVVLLGLSIQSNWLFAGQILGQERSHSDSEDMLPALEQFGGIFSFGGLLAAGACAALLSGSLAGLKQFGVAVSIGLMFDALVVRPLILPACLLLFCNSGARTETLSEESSFSSLETDPLGQAVAVPQQFESELP